MEVHLVRELPDEVTGSLLSCQFIGAGMKVDQFCRCRENKTWKTATESSPSSSECDEAAPSQHFGHS